MQPRLIKIRQTISGLPIRVSVVEVGGMCLGAAPCPLDPNEQAQLGTRMGELREKRFQRESQERVRALARLVLVEEFNRHTIPYPPRAPISLDPRRALCALKARDSVATQRRSATEGIDALTQLATLVLIADMFLQRKNSESLVDTILTERTHVLGMAQVAQETNPLLRMTFDGWRGMLTRDKLITTIQQSTARDCLSTSNHYLTVVLSAGACSGVDIRQITGIKDIETNPDYALALLWSDLMHERMDLAAKSSMFSRADMRECARAYVQIALELARELDARNLPHAVYFKPSMRGMIFYAFLKAMRGQEHMVV